MLSWFLGELLGEGALVNRAGETEAGGRWATSPLMPVNGKGQS